MTIKQIRDLVACIHERLENKDTRVIVIFDPNEEHYLSLTFRRTKENKMVIMNIEEDDDVTKPDFVDEVIKLANDEKNYFASGTCV